MQELRHTPQLLDEVRRSQLNEFQLQSKLRQRYPATLVQAALSLHELRCKARGKFSLADGMWLDRKSLEQATSEIVARHKAFRFQPLQTQVIDLCCGLGMDAIALAGSVPQVIAVDNSPAAILRTTWNAELYQVSKLVKTMEGDAHEFPITGGYVHMDPDRRAGKERAIRIEDYSPNLEFLQQLATNARGGAIKLSPASNFGGRFPGCEMELISVDGECKEATVWFGELAGPTQWRATILPENQSLTGNPWLARAEVGTLDRYLCDPDPAVVRAGLVDVLAEQEHLIRLDAAEEYLTLSSPRLSPFYKTFKVLDCVPYDERDLKAWFSAHPCGDIEIKCRHVAVDVEKLRRKLPREGAGRLTLIVANIAGHVRGVLARRITSTTLNEQEA